MWPIFEEIITGMKDKKFSNQNSSMKSTLLVIKITVARINSRIDLTEENVSEFALNLT